MEVDRQTYIDTLIATHPCRDKVILHTQGFMAIIQSHTTRLNTNVLILFDYSTDNVCDAGLYMIMPRNGQKSTVTDIVSSRF